MPPVLIVHDDACACEKCRGPRNEKAVHRDGFFVYRGIGESFQPVPVKTASER